MSQQSNNFQVSSMSKSLISWFSLDGRILALRVLPQSQTQWKYFFLLVGVIHKMEDLYVHTASENHFNVLEKKKIPKRKMLRERQQERDQGEE